MKAPLITLSLALVLTACGGSDKPAADAPKTEATPTQAPAPAATPAPSATPEAKPAPASSAAPDKAALTEQAKNAAQKLGGTLKGELEAAMQAGGPIAALSICNLKAPEIAKAVSTESGMQVSRVSLKNRNPVMGQANEWQVQVLNDFEARKAKGETPDTLAYADIVGNEYRFMKAIPTASVCLACHGSTIAPDVSAKISELYPNDKAIGYKEGDIRGAFVVVKDLTASATQTTAQ
ncbi:MAG: DUF3365 domain-containing protein [Thiofilum sp.]|uniref:Tll0287-like domain-containing protein n=1 Tax=Thiofilum sp. TaxID=2212733 RepID=UPI0025D1C385|nr:DUF3365 domain-containing protein [Thiofilum sp.]MBK8452386.1 DUF3365 domain-containing protein [Thiofilum sp.]